MRREAEGVTSQGQGPSSGMNARRSKRISPGGYPELVDEIELMLIHLTFTPWRLCGKINLDPDYSLAPV